MEMVNDLNLAKIGELVAEDYRKAEVFKKFGLDFCCGGGKSITQACEEKGINKAELVEALKSLEEQPKDNAHDYNNWELDFLADFIINTHHKYVRENLPLIGEFAEKVAKVHGEADPEVIEIARSFEELTQELNMHMQKEETILFPYIKQLVAAKRNATPIQPSPFGTIANPISMMEHEHDSAGEKTAEIKQLSHDYNPPDHACNTYRVLYAKLKEFEDDLHQHIHLENNLLFPKTIQLEQEL